MMVMAMPTCRPHHQHLRPPSPVCFKPFCLLLLLFSVAHRLPSHRLVSSSSSSSSSRCNSLLIQLLLASSALILHKFPSCSASSMESSLLQKTHIQPSPETHTSVVQGFHAQSLKEVPLPSMAASSQQALHPVKTLYMEGADVLSATSAKRETLHPQIFFEVTTPLDPPPSSPCASLHVFSHSFANSYSLSPAMANYTPPSAHACNNPSRWSLVVLTWSGSSVGRQFDRIAAVWFGGVEFLRTCTAEPTKQGIYWEVKKDVTKYASLLAEPQPIVVELANIVNDKLTGVFHINLTLDFFSVSSHGDRNVKPRERPADLVLPMSAPSPLPVGHWFQILNNSDLASRNFSVPANVYKAVLEVYVSFHGDDEFWYTNPPNEYIISNNLTGVPGNGAFREVQARLDGQLVAAIWPFPVVYTGGIINLYWRPAAAIGAFNLPTYEFDLSPFVGSLTRKRQHAVEFRVENAIGTWYIDGALHLWLDDKLTQTSGRLIGYEAPPYMTSLRSNFKGLDATFQTSASRKLSYSGVVVSSAGNRSVSSSYVLKFENTQVYKNSSALQTTSQSIHTNAEIKTEASLQVVLLQESSYSFPLDLSCFSYEGANRSLVLNCNLSHAFDKQVHTFGEAGNSFELLNNRQQGQGEIVVINSTVVAGIGVLQQRYRAEGTHECYNRELSTKNNTILSDNSSNLCSVESWQT